MKTLIIVSHPDIDESGSQQYLKEALPDSSDITYHHLETTYPDGKIDIEQEQALLQKHDRIIFQFPLYWYSSPPMLKHWLDEVLTENFAYGYGGNKLKGKELGLVLVIGMPEKEYQVGGNEGFSLSALTTPYQAMAKKTQMQFLKPFLIFQFHYMTENEKKRILIAYQQYLMIEKFDTLRAKEAWTLEQMEAIDEEMLPAGSSFILDQVKEIIEDNRMELDEIQMYLEQAGGSL
ncbi:NAD(P)H dehydrogenase [Tetragenococcus osmophilus]|uniref:NAD(P)H dehydrogenase n=2 Tax=Tetragenococcus TaxID=51668 RepID=A0AA38CXX7_9ENTE|nr:NAD(P)H-dependent oxidoreductase [Tetragenococcus osmophilus]AYW47395.1 NAD(P)H dehydrogenase [Tetragenococcus osmophilus]GMA52966.1 NAD(P)H dehydrogenase [Alicyclobacillus contaminans]GMA73046.1 NAD(P)H dehydrogenase [Tetragenococcus osmophilus]